MCLFSMGKITEMKDPSKTNVEGVSKVSHLRRILKYVCVRRFNFVGF